MKHGCWLDGPGSDVLGRFGYGPGDWLYIVSVPHFQYGDVSADVDGVTARVRGMHG